MGRDYAISVDRGVHWGIIPLEEAANKE